MLYVNGYEYIKASNNSKKKFNFLFLQRPWRNKNNRKKKMKNKLKLYFLFCYYSTLSFIIQCTWSMRKRTFLSPLKFNFTNLKENSYSASYVRIIVIPDRTQAFNKRGILHNNKRAVFADKKLFVRNDCNIVK